MIVPRILKGFRDFTPEMMIPKKEMIRNLEDIFEGYGFVPIDTPALEYSEILLGKGGGETDKQIYRFNDQGGRDIALRYDLTVPLARFIAAHYAELIFPFKRYHIAPVWRGEKNQKGRYREFFQCDFDIIGEKSIHAELEILLVIKAGLEKINCGPFVIAVNQRKLLNSILEKFDLAGQSVQILRIIDKIYKIGRDGVIDEMVNTLGINEERVAELLTVLNLDDSEKKLGARGEQIFALISQFKALIDPGDQAILDDLEYLFTCLAGIIDINCFSFNPAITRGLDYYTGIVFESFITDSLEFGSVCSGGRYDQLTSVYSKNPVTGVGSSFGLDRMISLMQHKNKINSRSTVADLLIFNLDENRMADYVQLAETLRKKGIKTEIILRKQKIAQQFKLAARKGIQYVIISGEEEFKQNKFNLKNITSGEEQNQLEVEKIISILKG